MMRRFAKWAIVIGVLVATIGAGAWAAERSDRLTPMDVFNIQTASDPQISPNGKQIVYVRQFAGVMTDRRASNLLPRAPLRLWMSP
jgi:acylaminoacyl-peptidase